MSPAPGSASTARAGRLTVHHHCTSSCSYGQSSDPLSSPVVSRLIARHTLRQRLDRDCAAQQRKEKLPHEPWPEKMATRWHRTSGRRRDAISRVIRRHLGPRQTVYHQTTNTRAHAYRDSWSDRLLCEQRANRHEVSRTAFSNTREFRSLALRNF